MGQAVGGLLVWTSLLVFIAVFLLILYLFTRNKGVGFNLKFVGGDEDTTKTQTVEAFSTQSRPVQDSELLGHYVPPPDPNAPPPNPTAGRDAFLKTLDGVERVLANILICLYYFVLVAATVAMAWIYFEYPDDGNRDFMLFYGGVIYLVGMLALTLQISKTHQRLRSNSGGPNLIEQLRSKVQVHVQSAPPEVGFIDAASIERARRHVAGGGTLDEACALVDARYQQMTGWSKDVFRKAVEMTLEKEA